MIKIKQENSLFFVSFWGNEFQQALNLVKRMSMKFQPDTKLWSTNNVGSIIALYKEFDPNSFIIESIELKEKINTALGLGKESSDQQAEKTKKSRFRFSQYFKDNFLPKFLTYVKFDRECLKVPPIKGKPPFENFQLEDISYAVQFKRMHFADEMGCGKTYQTISVLNHLFKHQSLNKVLVISPTEVVVNWKRELLKFSTFIQSEDEINIATKKNRQPFNENTKVVIMTYSTFSLIAEDFYKKKGINTSAKRRKKTTLPTIDAIKNWGSSRALILDESHSVKNMKTKRFKLISANKNLFSYRYLLSGTPIPNGIHEIWTQFDILGVPLLSDNYYDFLSHVANLGNKFSPYAINYFYQDKVKEVLDTISPFMIRRKTKDVLDIPEDIVIKNYVQIGKKQNMIYETFSKYIITKLIEENGELTTKEITNTFSYLTSVLHDPSVIKNSNEIIDENLRNMIQTWKFEENSKLPVLDSLIENHIKETKVIIWTGHPVIADKLAIHLQKYSPIVVHGDIKSPRGVSNENYRDTLVESFKTNPEHKILIASYLILDKGVNIVEANMNIYFDRNYSLTNWLQSRGRTYRIGQNKFVQHHVIITEKSLEESQDKILDTKSSINASIKGKKIDMDNIDKLISGEL